MSLAIDLADAVAGELNAEGSPIYGLATAMRSYRPRADLADAFTLRVSVIPRSLEQTAIDRGTDRCELQIDVVVQQAVAGFADAGLDELMDLVQDLLLYLRKRRLAPLAAAVWIRTSNEPVYVPERLENQSEFLSVLSVVYQMLR
jgi:hypothetical protein